ncbi:MAG TPA: shikimate dehydrogenase [Chitinispirillaceae bacterium]|nr:shikimate dehydrogenase [Chitinispirillaceae bacterium]
MDSHIRGSSRVVCLLGHPVAHSISPQIHNHAFRTLGLPYVYIPVAVKKQALSSVIFTMRSCGFAGANVTIPHKTRVTNYCDSLSDLSKVTGTVNTLYFEENRLCGTTTDYEGFKRALNWMGCELNDRNVVILGNGGTARTLSLAIALEKKVESLAIVGRNKLKIDSLASEITDTTGFFTNACSFEDAKLEAVMQRCTLLVNCTCVGMHPDIDASPIPGKYLHSNMVVFDAIYNPLKTKLLQDAESVGCVVQNGLRMLLFQGLASFKHWTGRDVPEDIFEISELQKLILK